MSDQSILDYVDRVMSQIEASKELKAQIENELIRNIMEASENTSMDEVKNSLCSPEKFAEEITKKLVKNKVEASKAGSMESNQVKHHRKVHYQRYPGEFMQEHSNVNIKLLYIPLLQISSGTQRIIMPLTDEDEDEDD
jgi:hypothetical protein